MPILRRQYFYIHVDTIKIVSILLYDKKSVLYTGEMRKEDVSSNYELGAKKRRIKYDITKLQQPNKRGIFSVKLENRFQVLDETTSRRIRMIK